MTEEPQKRVSDRYLHEAPIMFTCSPDHPYCYYGARMLNHGMGGVYFESRYPVEVGSIIYFNRAAYSMSDYGPDTYKPHCIKVMWCTEAVCKEEGYYGIGAKYVDPAVCRRSADSRRPVESVSGLEADSIVGEYLSADAEGIECQLSDSEQKLKSAMEIAETRADKLTVLNRFAASVGSTLDLNEILQSVCKEMTQIFHARNTGIGLLDRHRTKITLVAFHAADPEENDATGLDMPLEGNAATHRVVETGQAIVVPDVQHNPLTRSIHEIARKRGTECLMIVPLLSRGEVIGTIGLPTADKSKVFTTEDVALAQTIASQTASAIENARLYEKTEKAREKMEQDLEIGRKIQTEFFPESLPVIPGWEIAAHFQPARQVSGDFYDLFPMCNNQSLGLVIADVCDHGVGSALFMVLFRSLIRAYAEPSFRACEINGVPDSRIIQEALGNTIRLTNKYIADTHEKSGMFATLFFGVLHPGTGVLSYINGGHEAPLILGDRGIEAALKPTGPAVGLDADHSFVIEQTRIEPGRTLFLYTDGTTDAQNREGEYFTKKRLMDLIKQPFDSPDALVQNIATKLRGHVGGSDLYDDVTLMAIGRK